MQKSYATLFFGFLWTDAASVKALNYYQSDIGCYPVGDDICVGILHSDHVGRLCVLLDKSHCRVSTSESAVVDPSVFDLGDLAGVYDRVKLFCKAYKIKMGTLQWHLCSAVVSVDGVVDATELG